MSDIPTLKGIPTYEKMPDCEYYQVGEIRVARYGNECILQVLYMDGLDSLFWGPLPVVDNPINEKQEPEK